MTEATQVWTTTRRMVGQYGRFKRIENMLEGGTPDVSYTLLRPRGVQGWLELKLFEAVDKCPHHFTREQLIWGEEEVQAGGNWHLFGRCGSTWIMFTAAEARKLFDGDESSPIFQQSGHFPLKQFLTELAKPQPPGLW